MLHFITAVYSSLIKKLLYNNAVAFVSFEEELYILSVLSDNATLGILVNNGTLQTNITLEVDIIDIEGIITSGQSGELTIN